MFGTQNLQLAVVEVSTSPQTPAPVHENLQAEANTMADEIIAELTAEAQIEASGSCTIRSEKTYDDVSDPEAMQAEKIARLKRLVANGEYEIDPLLVAKALVESGDLS
jgi:anti-sigma28 factor (negative regulator of flagellin synthesis)